MQDGQSTVALGGFPGDESAALADYLEDHYRVLEVGSAEEAIEESESQSIDIFLCQQSRPRFDALRLFQHLRVAYPKTIRIIGGKLTGTEIDTALSGAAVYQFFPPSWQPEQIELMVRRALENRELAHRHRHLNRRLKIAEDLVRGKGNAQAQESNGGYHFDELVYSSEAMASVCSDARKAARTDLPVLIHGETGTGKELMARAIHFHSPRKRQPLMIQNCGGLPDDLLQSELFGHTRGAYTGAVTDRLGLFPAADGGTVFLDEISEVSPTFQVALLRFLQEGEVKPLGSDRTIRCNVRIIAACNRNLEQMVEAKEFRRDLYYRLNGFKLEIPPLRKRTEEIKVLAEYLAHRYSESIRHGVLGISPEVLEKFQLYSWPGNVRELDNEVKRMVAMSDSGSYLTVDKLAPHIASLIQQGTGDDTDWAIVGETLKEKVEFLEARLVEEALRRNRWNQSRSAVELGLSRVGLANKIKRYGLDLQGVND
ncbi:MAG: sigma-54 dependent transcriptional regulator [Pseudomonadota bacterium]